jgi:hypothetical protein
MKLAATIIGVVLVLIGAIWTLQGANILGGSVMTGQSMWLVIGLIAVIAGLGLLYWYQVRGRTRP